jgi:hypothetical protein
MALDSLAAMLAATDVDQVTPVLRSSTSAPSKIFRPVWLVEPGRSALSHPGTVVVDEFQRAPSVLSVVKQIVDSIC